MSYIGSYSEKTRKHTAAWMLTSRRSARVPTQTGSTAVVVRPAGKVEVLAQNFDWIIKGEDLVEFNLNFNPDASFFNKISTTESFARLVGNGTQIERKFMCSSDSRIEVPEGATIISKTPFTSYYYPTAKGNIGYVKIPHYSPQGTDSRLAIEVFMSQYQKVIGVMEKNTVG